MYPSGGWRRHRDDLVAPIGSVNRIANHRQVIFKVAAGHEPASFTDRSNNLVGDRTKVECLWTFASDRFQHIRELGLNELVAQGWCGAAGFQKNPRRGRPPREPFLFTL